MGHTKLALRRTRRGSPVSFRSAVLAVLLPVAFVSCLAPMRDYQGHTIFNPLYLFYLESPKRDRWQKPEQVLDALRLPAGAVVADIGAGGGYFTEKFANRVGPTGHVYATDVQEIMLRRLRTRAADHHLANVTVVRAEFDDPKLPPETCDLAFFSSVYKEISHRVEYMQKLRGCLKKDGRVAILEYRPETKSPGPPVRYRLTEARVIGEMQAAGFVVQEKFDFLPRENFLVFGVKPPAN